MSKQKVKMKYNIINKIEEIKESDMHFENVIKVNDHEYITVLSAYQLAELYDDENIVYMTSSQRGTKIVRNEEIPISSTKNIKEMMDLIKEDSLCTSYITLGSPEGNVEYAEDNLNVKSQLFILDGWNRLSSCYMLYMYNNIINDVDMFETLVNTKFTILIGEYSEQRAKDIFSQYSRGLKLSKSRVESFDSTKASNRIVNKLNKNSFIKNKINDVGNSIAKSDKTHIWAFGSFNEAIKNSFGVISSEEEENNVYNFLSAFFKELMFIFPELNNYEQREISKQYSFLCRNVMIYGFIALANDLYIRNRNGNWKEELQKIKQVNFDIENEAWNPVIRWNGSNPTIVNNRNTRDLIGRILKGEFYKIQ